MKKQQQFVVAAVYTKQSGGKLSIQHFILNVDAVSSEEAIGKAIIAFEKEAPDYQLFFNPHIIQI